MFPFQGERVVRGPDWEYNDDDGGDGCVGTVIDYTVAGPGNVESDTIRRNYKVQKVRVAWDLSQLVGVYRAGLDGKYDLAHMDMGTGYVHVLSECDVCKNHPAGYRWLCTVCRTYDLCDACYNKQEEHLDHPFARFNSTLASFVRAPSRESSLNARREARGLFVGAKVFKDGKHGIVMETLDYREKHVWGAVTVSWDGTDEATLHVRNKDGVIDIQCEEPAKYMRYYKDHLAKLGENNMLVNDSVSVLMDVDQIKQMQKGHGGWIPQMTDSLRQVGIFIAVTYRGDCKITFPVLGLEWEFNSDAVTKLEVFGIGDTVRLISDEERVKMIQPGHGEWKDEMRQDLGEEGTVLMVQESGDIKVLINGHPWTVHPACLTLIKAEEERSPTDWEEAQKVIIQNWTQDCLIQGADGAALSSMNAQKEEIIRFVNNARKGNLAAVKQTLETNPHWVNIQVKNRTALDLACQENHLEVIKYLLSKKALLEGCDERGFRPLHYAVTSPLNILGPDYSFKVVEYLLRAGAYPSAVSDHLVSPVHLAAINDLPECAAMLLKYGSNVNVQDHRGDLALHFAIEGESIECQKLLIESPTIDLTLRNRRGYNALSFAAERNSESAVNLILDKMPTLATNKKDDGLTPLHIAALHNNYTIARILIEKGRCPIDSLCNSNMTPLFVAVGKGASETVEFLVSHGADINIPTDIDLYSQTCLHVILQGVQRAEYDVDDNSLTLRKIRASMREIGVSTPGGALACYLVKNGGRLDIPDSFGDKPMDHVVDPKLKECLEKCLATYSPHHSPSPARLPKQERNTILPRVLPFLKKDQKRPALNVESLDDIINHDEPAQIEISIDPFKVDDTELPLSPMEDFSVDSITPDHVVTDEDLKKNVEKAAEHACSVCEEQLTQLLGVPCQHVQAWPGEEESAIPTSAAAQKEPPKRVVSVLRRQNSEFRVALACTVCFQRKKGVVFECGHSTCKECAELLPDCPVCRKPSSKVIPLYL